MTENQLQGLRLTWTRLIIKWGHVGEMTSGTAAKSCTPMISFKPLKRIMWEYHCLYHFTEEEFESGEIK